MTNKLKLFNIWQLYAMLALPIIYLLIFKYYPMYGAVISFKDYSAVKGIMGSEWVGLKHFTRFFVSHDFWTMMWNTISLSLYQLIAGTPFPIILALCLNYARNKMFKNTVQMISYAPHFISVVVMVGILMQFLAPRTGLIANLASFFGVSIGNWMGNPDYFQSIYVWSGIWQNVGFSCIIYLAGLAGIDPSLHEAAVVDGASKLRRMWHIDLPGILPIVIILLILNVGNMMEIGFEKVLLMQNPLNLRTSEVIDTYVYKVGLISPIANFSYSAAIGVFKNVVNLVLLVMVNQLARRAKQTSLW
ncbi:sugar ABC transporter permease [Paenibacillus sp. YYML68]|uniref:ABC transporter permease n=1 Tax=Paenibacillus sp. YYML68 TaxID=2909250 RepID=UPI002491D872|nr:ABC transporter permease subunit [Paenibacillus sp. YYML68]